MRAVLQMVGQRVTLADGEPTEGKGLQRVGRRTMQNAAHPPEIRKFVMASTTPSGVYSFASAAGS